MNWKLAHTVFFLFGCRFNSRSTYTWELLTRMLQHHTHTHTEPCILPVGPNKVRKAKDSWKLETK